MREPHQLNGVVLLTCVQFTPSSVDRQMPLVDAKTAIKTPAPFVIKNDGVFGITVEETLRSNLEKYVAVLIRASTLSPAESVIFAGSSETDDDVVTDMAFASVVRVPLVFFANDTPCAWFVSAVLDPMALMTTAVLPTGHV